MSRGLLSLPWGIHVYGFSLAGSTHGEVYVTLTFALAGSTCVCLKHSW